MTSQIEHPAVLDTCAYLAQQGYTVTYVPVDAHGVVDPEAVREALTDETILVSIMYANNETGVLQPIADIAHLVRQRGILMHTDAVQAFGKMPLRVDELGVDFLSFSGHKLYAPKGIGGWYARPGAPLHALLHGGHQERGMRAGTEHVAGIVALGQACALACVTCARSGSVSSGCSNTSNMAFGSRFPRCASRELRCLGCPIRPTLPLLELRAKP